MESFAEPIELPVSALFGDGCCNSLCGVVDLEFCREGFRDAIAPLIFEAIVIQATAPLWVGGERTKGPGP